MRIEEKIAVAVFMGWKFELASKGKPYKIWNPDFKSDEAPPDDWVMSTWIKEDFEQWIDERLKYNTSWDALMPVVEKIEKMGHRTNIICDEDLHSVCIYKNLFSYGDDSKEIILCTDPGKHKKKIDAIYDAVVQFTQWYNSTPLSQ